jgi:O-antigen/teichoic acid export membrane protein
LNIIPAFIYKRIAHRPSLLKIADNIGWLFFDKILRVGLGLFVGVWIARYLGPEQFGLLSFATAFVGLFSAMAALGLRGIVVRDIVRNPEGAPKTLGTAAVLQLFSGLVSYLLILTAIAYLRADDTLARSIIAILGSITLLKASEIVVYWFESQVQSKYTVWAQTGTFLLFAILKVALILYEAPLASFAWLILGEAIVIALALVLIMGWRGKSLSKLRFDICRAKTLLRDSWPLLLSGMVLMVQGRIDQIMLGQMVGDLQVGYYSVALRMIETASMTAMMLHSSFLPSLVSAKKRSEKLYLERLEAFYGLNIIVSLFIGVPIAIFSPWIIQILYGEAYLPSALIMSIMTIRLLFAHIGLTRGIYLLNENLLKFSALTMVIGTVVNIILNIFMIPIFLAVGATFASLISFFVTIFVLDIFYARTRRNVILMIRSTFTSAALLRRKLWVS